MNEKEENCFPAGISYQTQTVFCLLYVEMHECICNFSECIFQNPSSVIKTFPGTDFRLAL